MLHCTIARSFICNVFVVLGMADPVTVETIDAYMSKLHATITESPHSHDRLTSAVREVVGRLSVEG